jgi:energy-converting hydrogenase Eha subunit G
MFGQAWNAISGNSWALAIATFAFFTVKGLLWLVVPYLVVRSRSWFVRTDP